MRKAGHHNLSLYTKHRAALVDYASAITGDSGEAEDVVQEAWLRVEPADSSGSIKEPLRYLYRVVRNLAIDVRRRSARNPANPALASDVQEITLLDTRPDQEAALIAASELDAVTPALAELPERTRTAIRLHRIEGKPLKEVAAVLGISITRAHGLVAEGIAHCDRRRKAAITRPSSRLR